MSSKKIGLAVCYDTKNFGSQLQVLATDTIIKELGYDTEIIRYRKKISFIYALQTIPRFFNPYFVSGKIRKKIKEIKIKRHPDIQRNIIIRDKRFKEFVNKNFNNFSREYVGWNDLTKATNDYDAFLCGSDQLWLPQNLGSHFYTLEFANNKTKIAYATSFGVSFIPWFQKSRTRNYLSDFFALSTRELKGQNIIKSLTGKYAQVVCDPTLLFDEKKWANIVVDRKVINEKYVFCYFLGDNKEHREIARKFAGEKSLLLVTCPFLDNYLDVDNDFGDIQMFDLDASDFVNLIRHASYVLTDSFHGTVFSILHHKKFITFNRFGNERCSRNSRLDSLFQLLELEGRRYNGNEMQADEEIDYSKTDNLLNTFRQNSIEYLSNALSSI